MDTIKKSLVWLLALGWLCASSASYAQPEDAVQTKIRQETEEATATAYTVVFDNSGSMAGARLEKAQKAFRWWLTSVQPGNVWSLLKFMENDGVLVVPFTLNGQDKVARMINTLRADSNTPIVKTLKKAEEQIALRKQSHPYERHVLLVFTDGEENQDPAGNRGVVRKIADLRRKGIEVVGIGYAGAGDYMANVASRYFQADDEASLRKGLSKVEVEIDVMTPVNVTPEELKQMANPPPAKPVTADTSRDDDAPVRSKSAPQSAKSSGLSPAVWVAGGIVVLFAILKAKRGS
jgi:Mg-chelatase subunit ChlD